MFINGKKIESEQINCDNPSDFRKIYDANYTTLYKVCYRIVKDEEATEDLVHDAFIKANEKHMVFPTMDDAKFWLICVVRNASLNFAKRQLREAKAYHKALYEGRQHIESGEIDLLKDESIRLTREAINKLSPNLREVVILREYADMNYKDIGKALGITEGNVKVRIFRAREQLVKILGEEDVYLS